ncbi:MAG: TMEM165/GDT1 family protein [Alphaproteobacteria bacterium]
MQILVSSASLVAVVEIGYKTQTLALMLAAHYGRALPIILGITLATIALASEYQALLWVTLGTTIGMLIANIPPLFLGEAFIAKIPMKPMCNLASIAFVGFGVYQIFQFV